MPLAEQDIPYQQEVRQEFANKLKKMTPIDKFTALEGYKLGIRYAEEQTKNIATGEKLATEIMQKA